MPYYPPASSGSAITVKEVDGAPSVNPVTEIKVSNGTLTDNTGGSVSIATGASGAGTITTVKDEGSTLSSAVTDIDFVGAGVTATGTTSVTVTIPGGSGTSRYFPGMPSGTLDRTYTFASTVESWTTTAGTLSSTGARLRLTHTSPAVAIEPVGASTFTDGEIVFGDFVPSSVTGSMGLCWRVVDSSNFYALIFATGSLPTVYKCVSGSFTVLQTFGINGSGTNRWPLNPQDGIGLNLQVMIRAVATRHEIYFNGALWMLFTDSAISSAGRVGMRADNATMDIDNVAVYLTTVRTGNVVVA